MIELWKDIPGYENKYQVSSMGKIKSFMHKNARLLKPIVEKDGYLVVNLYCKRKQVMRKVHRLVGEAFVPKIDGKNCINHKNCDKRDNRIENLEWCNNQENMDHAYENELIPIIRGENHPQARLTDKQVNEIREKYVPFRYGQNKLSKEYGVSRGHINLIIHNYRRSCA